jgi:hypothetical protein
VLHMASLTHLVAGPVHRATEGGWNTFVALIPKPGTLLAAAFLSILC